uniref:Neuroglian n=1 Tax=Steinernema glaseri TaxID=37863 RepID=A0A1I7YC14_9BILA
MDHVLLLLISISLLTASCDELNESSVPNPPRFTHRPNDPFIYFADSSLMTPSKGSTLGMRTLRCSAVGNPTPIYTWRKNGAPFTPDMFSKDTSLSTEDGSLIFRSPVPSDQGDYQCEASNAGGSAFSEPIRLEMVKMLHAFPYRAPEVVEVGVGDSYTRSCVPPKSNPDAEVYWILKSESGFMFKALNNSRISVGDEGTIFFHYVTETDLLNVTYYTCVAQNIRFSEVKFGHQFRLNVTKKNSEKTYETPRKLYARQSNPVAVVGKTHKLSCFYRGNPVPTPTWYFNSSKIINNNIEGYSFQNYGRTLAFKASEEKAGVYECRFPERPEMTNHFDVVVESAPRWIDKPPANMKTGEGETVTFKCEADGNPRPTFSFYKNGVEIHTPNDNKRLNINGSTLTIYNVEKNVDGAVYQCKVQNQHGHLWSNFHLAVFESTQLFCLHAYPINNDSPAEQGVVVLKWKDPFESAQNISIQACLVDEETCLPAMEAMSNGRQLRLDSFEHDKEYKFVFVGLKDEEIFKQSVMARTLPQEVHMCVCPAVPSLTVNGVGDTSIDVTFVPGEYNMTTRGPIGNVFYFMIRPVGLMGEDGWMTVGITKDFDRSITSLAPRTQYEIVAVSIQKHTNGVILKTQSDPYRITTSEKIEGIFNLPYRTSLAPRTQYEVVDVSVQAHRNGTVHEAESDPYRSSTSEKIVKLPYRDSNETLAWWAVMVVVSVVALLLICCGCFYLLAKHGTYSVSKKERKLGTESGSTSCVESFAEYGALVGDQKSLTSATESEDSKKSKLDYIDV